MILEERDELEAKLEIRDNAEETLRELLRALLEKGICRALLVPVKLPAGGGVVPTLLQDPDLLESALPLAPVMPFSEATIAGRLTRGDRRGTLGIVLHPCQIRAYIELVKLQQAERENVLTIGIDCPGTYELTRYVGLASCQGTELAGQESNPGLDLLPGLRRGEPAPHDGYAFREACQMCEWPLPEQADLRIKITGVESGAELRVRAGADLLEQLGLTAGASEEGQDQAERRLLEARIEERDRILSDFRSRVHDMPGLLEQFSTCIRCLNCMDVCPLCYCRECIFRTETFDHHPSDYERWADRKGAVRLPADTLLFHLTRLNHIVTSCVGCGLCDSACPSDLPVARVFRAVGQKVQGIFEYVPGRDLAEEIPISTFREDELE